MKYTSTILIFFLSLILSAIGHSQALDEPWVQSYQLEGNTKFTSLVIDDTENVYLAGNIDQASLIIDGQNRVCGVNTAVIIKFDPNGSVLWDHCVSPGEITDIDYSEGSVYYTGKTANGFIVKRLDAETGEEVTNISGLAAILSVNDTGTAGANGYGLDIEVRDGFVYFGGMITASGFNVKRVGSATGPGILPNNLVPRGPDDFYIGRIDTTFDTAQLNIIQMGHLNIAELSSKFDLITQPTGLVSARFETRESAFRFDSVDYNKSINNEFESLIYTYDFNTETITEPFTTVSEITHFAGRGTSSGFAWIEKTGPGEDLLRTSSNNILAEGTKSITATSSINFTITGLAASRVGASLYTIYGYSDDLSGTLGGISIYPANGTIGKTNVYALSVTGNTLIFGDVDNLGEVDGSRVFDLSSYNSNGVKRYAYSGSLDSNSDLLLGATEIPIGSNNSFVMLGSNTYFKFQNPKEGTVFKQFETNTLLFAYEEVSAQANFANNGVIISNDDFVTNIPVTTSFVSKYKRAWAKPANLQGTYKMTYPGRDTVSFTIEPAGLLNSNPGTVDFGNTLLNRVVRDTVVFTNDGFAATTIESVEILNGSDFSVVEALSGEIGIGLKDTLIVEYKAQKVGFVKDTVQIKHSGAFGTINYIAQGIGLSIAVDAKFAVDSNATQTTLPFNPFAVADSTQIGQTDTLSTYIVSAGTDSLKISSIAFAKGTEFRLETTPSTPLTLLPTPENGLEDRLLRLDIIFEPTEFKTFKDTLFIQSNDSVFTDGLIVMPLQAIGKDSLGRLESNLNPIIFNSVLSENDTANVVLNLSNTGLKDLVIGSVTFSDDYFELGESVFGNVLEPLVTTEIAVGANFNVVLQAKPNFYDLLNDTTFKETMTINHDGSGSKSTFEIVVNIVKTNPEIQFVQVFTNSIEHNYPAGEVIEIVGLVPIQDFRTKQIEFTNVGTDTLSVDGIALIKTIESNLVSDDKIATTISLTQKVLAPGETGTVTLEYELFEFSTFVIDLKLFTDATKIHYKVSQFSALTIINTENGDFSYKYTGQGDVPLLNVELFEILTDTIRPSFVNVLFQATDPNGVGITFLDQANPDQLVGGDPKPNFFTLKEQGAIIAPGNAESDFQILKQDAIDFEINTALVLDASASITFDNKPLVIEAAIELVRNIEKDQKIAIYSFSSGVQKIQDFTSDTTQLINAINSYDLGGSSTNLFGGVVTSANDLNLIINSSLNKITRGNIVVFTDGAENTGQFTLQEVQTATLDIDVYAVGVGDADQAQLQQITGFSGRVFQAEDPSVLAAEFRKIQREIAKIANSFYWINYISPKRFGEVDITVNVDGNSNFGTSGTLSTSFFADGFSDVSAQVVVNQNFPGIFGVDTLFVPANGDTIVTAVTILNNVSPTYKWESSNESKVTVTPTNTNGSMANLNASGVEGDIISVTVTDTSNINLQGVKLSKTVIVVLGEKVVAQDFVLDIIADQTGTFELGETGVSLTITSNTGDGFKLTTRSATNPGTDLPEGIEIIFQDIYWIINLESPGTPEFEYSISLDVSGLTLEIPERVTVLKRDNSSSPWVDLSTSGLTVSLENDIITVSGLTSFSEFAIAQKSETVSNERFSDIPSSFSLEQNYPNPFNPSTVINFGLPNASDVSIDLFNVIGQKIMTIANNRYQAGWHNITLDASGLASGIYIYRIQAGSYVQTKRMTLIK